MIAVKIHGVEYPLCLTVAALDDINSQCGGIEGISAFLNGGQEPSYEKMFENTAWFLALLLREGEENRIICEHFADGIDHPIRRDIPNLSEIRSGFTLASITSYRTAIMQAVHESLAQEIEAVYAKKKENEEQE